MKILKYIGIIFIWILFILFALGCVFFDTAAILKILEVSSVFDRLLIDWPVQDYVFAIICFHLLERLFANYLIKRGYYDE